MAGLQHDGDVLAGYAVAELSEKKLGSSDDHIVSDAASHELDGIHDGLEFPTEEEKATLRRVADDVPWGAYRKYPCISDHCQVTYRTRTEQ